MDLEKRSSFTFSFACQAIRMLVSALAVTLLWRWFVVPLGVPSISYVWSIGLIEVVGCFRQVTLSDAAVMSDPKVKNRTYQDNLTLTIAWVVATGMSILVGYLCHLGT